MNRESLCVRVRVSEDHLRRGHRRSALVHPVSLAVTEAIDHWQKREDKKFLAWARREGWTPTALKSLEAQLYRPASVYSLGHDDMGLYYVRIFANPIDPADRMYLPDEEMALCADYDAGILDMAPHSFVLEWETVSPSISELMEALAA